MFEHHRIRTLLRPVFIHSILSVVGGRAFRLVYYMQGGAKKAPGSGPGNISFWAATVVYSYARVGDRVRPSALIDEQSVPMVIQGHKLHRLLHDKFDLWKLSHLHRCRMPLDHEACSAKEIILDIP